MSGQGLEGIDVKYSYTISTNVYYLGYVRSRIGGYWCKIESWHEYAITGIIGIAILLTEEIS